MDGQMTVTFAATLSRAECAKRLGMIGNPILTGVGRAFTVAVPDGTQSQWAHRYMRLTGVERVEYTRPRTVADS